MNGELKKDIKRLILVIVVIIVGVVICLLSCRMESPVSSSFNLNEIEEMLLSEWNMTIPAEGELEYEVDDIGGLPADSFVFTIVSYQANLELEKTYEWKKLEGEDEKYLESIEDMLTVPKDKRPNLNDAMTIKKTKEEKSLFIIKEKADQKLYIYDLRP